MLYRMLIFQYEGGMGIRIGYYPGERRKMVKKS